MANGAGEQMLDNIIQEAIKANEHPSPVELTCPAHGGLRLGVYALLCCRQEDRKAARRPLVKENGDRDWIEIGKGTVKAHGGTALICLVVLASMLYLRSSRVQPQTVVDADMGLKTFIVREVHEGIASAREEWLQDHKAGDKP